MDGQSCDSLENLRTMSSVFSSLPTSFHASTKHTNMGMFIITGLRSDTEKENGGKTKAELKCADQGWILNALLGADSAYVTWRPKQPFLPPILHCLYGTLSPTCFSSYPKGNSSWAGSSDGAAVGDMSWRSI